MLDDKQKELYTIPVPRRRHRQDPVGRCTDKATTGCPEWMTQLLVSERAHTANRTNGTRTRRFLEG